MTIDVDLNAVESLAAQGLSKKEIAYCLDIGESTLYERQKKDPEFLEAIKKNSNLSGMLKNWKRLFMIFKYHVAQLY